MSDSLPFTGERFVPGAPGEIWYEHWHRYHFAASLVDGREVLDVACGEGYGSALFARNARKVAGVDLAGAAIAHARARYAGHSNLEFHVADCTALPFPAGSFDTVVSFETIEHIAAQEAFLDEVRRVLRPEGLFVVSCPNKAEYTDKRQVVNTFHIRELYRDELEGLLTPRFPHLRWYGQRPGFFSVVWPEEGAAKGEIFELSERTPDAPAQGHARPLYFIALASASDATLAANAPRLSVLADRDEWVYRNYEEVTRGYLALERERAARPAASADSAATPSETAQLRDALSTAAAAAAKSDAERVQLTQVLAQQQAEVARRASVRWWLALPFRRLVNALRGKPPWA
jgi:SAM-dependent methyltransferase